MLLMGDRDRSCRATLVASLSFNSLQRSGIETGFNRAGHDESKAIQEKERKSQKEGRGTTDLHGSRRKGRGENSSLVVVVVEIIRRSRILSV